MSVLWCRLAVPSWRSGQEDVLGGHKARQSPHPPSRTVARTAERLPMPDPGSPDPHRRPVRTPKGMATGPPICAMATSRAVEPPHRPSGCPQCPLTLCLLAQGRCTAGCICSCLKPKSTKRREFCPDGFPLGPCGSSLCTVQEEWRVRRHARAVGMGMDETAMAPSSVPGVVLMLFWCGGGGARPAKFP